MFRGLQFSLTWRYTLVTVAALFIVEIIALLFFQFATAGSTLLPTPDSRALETIREKILTTGEPQSWLSNFSTPIFAFSDASGKAQIIFYNFPDRSAQTLYLIDSNQNLLAQTPTTHVAQLGARFDLASLKVLPPTLVQQLTQLPQQPIIPELLNASPQTRFSHQAIPSIFTYSDASKDRLISVVPVYKDQQLQRILIIITDTTTSSPLSAGFFLIAALSLLAFTVAAVIVGTLFGVFTARPLIHRIQHLALITAAWGHGDFSQPIYDSSSDEIGQLALHLNNVSQQLHSLLTTRQQLTALEERNRLARDLHDSVKQQAFAISMNLGTAQLLWEKNPQEAKAKLQTAIDLANQTQHELTSLIQTLRPAQLESQNLITALRELLQTWETQTKIITLYSLPETAGAIHESPLPDEIQQTIFRVTQEALANIAKHSGATKVNFALAVSKDKIALEIRDNGRGFDPKSQHGGLGLRSMRERVAEVGGAINVGSNKEGSVVKVELKL
jgi:NarL family two-component system sensor histidine kinase LiaS